MLIIAEISFCMWKKNRIQRRREEKGIKETNLRDIYELVVGRSGGKQEEKFAVEIGSLALLSYQG